MKSMKRKKNNKQQKFKGVSRITAAYYTAFFSGGKLRFVNLAKEGLNAAKINYVNYTATSISQQMLISHNLKLCVHHIWPNGQQLGVRLGKTVRICEPLLG